MLFNDTLSTKRALYSRNIVDFCLQGIRGSKASQVPGYTEILSDFSQSFQVNAETTPENPVLSLSMIVLPPGPSGYHTAANFGTMSSSSSSSSLFPRTFEHEALFHNFISNVNKEKQHYFLRTVFIVLRF
jgi:hypothetical protein